MFVGRDSLPPAEIFAYNDAGAGVSVSLLEVE